MRIPNSRLPTACRLLAWSTWLLACTADAQAPDLGWIDLDRLRAGDILFDFGEDPRFRELVRAAVIIDADPEDIWEILTDCGRAPEYVPHVESCELLETRDDGLTGIFRQEVKYLWFLPRFEHTFSMRFRPHERIDVERVSGPIEHLKGVWQILPAGGQGTLLVYDLELRPGLPVPRFLVGASLRRDIPTILAEVRDRAEALRQNGP